MTENNSFLRADSLGRFLGQIHWADSLGRFIGQIHWADLSCTWLYPVVPELYLLHFCPGDTFLCVSWVLWVQYKDISKVVPVVPHFFSIVKILLAKSVHRYGDDPKSKVQPPNILSIWAPDVQSTQRNASPRQNPVRYNPTVQQFKIFSSSRTRSWWKSHDW